MLISRNNIKNAFFLLGAEGISKVIALLFTIVLARELGVADFGKYCTALSLVLVFSVIIDVGLVTHTFREISKDVSLAGSYIINGLVIESLTAIVLTAVVLLLARMLGYPADTQTAIGILWVWVVCVRFGTLVRVVFKANERMEFDAAATVLEALLKFIPVYIVLQMGYGLAMTAVMIALSSILILFFSIATAQSRFMRFKFDPDWTFMKNLFVSSLPFALSLILTTSLYRIDTIFLSILKGDQDVGLYNAAYRLTLTLFIIPSLISQVFFPKLTQYALDDNNQEFSQLVLTLFKYMFLLIYPLLMVIYILAPQIIGFIYTDEYGPSVLLLKILVWCNIFNALNYVAIYSLNSAGHEKFVAKALGTGLMINIFLNLILIPPFSYFGAAISVITSQLVIFFVLGGYLKIHMNIDRFFDFKWFFTFSGLLICPYIAIFLGESIGLCLGEVLGCFIIVYLALVVLLKFITLQELGKLKELLFSQKLNVNIQA